MTDPTTPRHLRPAEYWELLYEMFPGATVLDDLADHPDDPEAARWIVVRYAAVRAAAALLGDTIDPQELRIERNLGLNYLAALPMLDREAWSLRQMLQKLTEEPTRPMVSALLNSGEGAERRGHGRGAYAIYHLVYRLAHPRKWHAEAGRAARGVERLARAGGAVYSPRMWRRRARVMERRAAVA